MLSERVWKKVVRIGIVVGIIASAATILDVLTRGIGFVSPTFRFILKILNLRAPIYIIIIVGLAVFLWTRLLGWKLTEEEAFVISFIGEGERALGLMFRGYKRAFPSNSRTISKCMASVRILERKRLIELAVQTGGLNSIQEEIFTLTKKGLLRFRKLGTALKEKGASICEEILIQSATSETEARFVPNDEKVFLLEQLAGQPNRAWSFRELEPRYRRQFLNTDRADFQILIGLLITDRMIGEIEYGEWGEIGYEIFESGLTYLRRCRVGR